MTLHVENGKLGDTAVVTCSGAILAGAMTAGPLGSLTGAAAEAPGDAPLSEAPWSLEPGAIIHVAGMDIGSLRQTFADVASGALVAFTGSGGTIEVAVRDGSAAKMLGVTVGAPVRAEQGRQ